MRSMHGGGRRAGAARAARPAMQQQFRLLPRCTRCRIGYKEAVKPGGPCHRRDRHRCGGRGLCDRSGHGRGGDRDRRRRRGAPARPTIRRGGAAQRGNDAAHCRGRAHPGRDRGPAPCARRGAWRAPSRACPGDGGTARRGLDPSRPFHGGDDAPDRSALQSLNERIAVIDHAQKSLVELSGHVVSLRDVLGNKQARGAFGQGRMEAIVTDGLPKNLFAFQHTLSNNTRPDCVIFLPDQRPLAIDASSRSRPSPRCAKPGAEERQRAAQRLRQDVWKAHRRYRRQISAARRNAGYRDDVRALEIGLCRVA